MFLHPPTNYRDRQVQQRFEIRHFLFVAHAQFAVVVHPRMRAFDHPTTRPAFGSMSGLWHSLCGDMRDVTALPHLFVGGFASVAFIHPEILGPAFRRLWAWYPNPVQPLRPKLHVLAHCPRDRKTEQGATRLPPQTS